MKKPMLQMIEDLIDFLPEKDIPIAKRLLKERKLEDLVDLISSALFKVEKVLSGKSKGNEQYDKYFDKNSENLMGLQKLYSEASMYSELVNGDIVDPDDDDDYSIVVNDLNPDSFCEEDAIW